VKKNNQLSKKIYLSIIIGVSLVIIISSWIEFRFTRKFIIYKTQSITLSRIKNSTKELKSDLKSFRSLTNNIATLISQVEMDSSQLIQLQKVALNALPNLNGIAIQASMDGKKLHFENYSFREDSFIKNYENIPYAFNSLTSSKTINGPIFYTDSSDTIFVIYSPILNNNDLIDTSFVAIDFKLSLLESDLLSSEKSESNNFFIVDNKGIFIYHPDKAVIWNESLHSLHLKYNKGEYLMLQNAIDEGKKRFYLPEEYNGKEAVYISPMSNFGWYHISFIPNHEISYSLLKHFVLVTSLTILGLFIVSIIISVNAKRIIKPLDQLSLALNRIENGDFHSSIPEITTADELDTLSQSLENIQQKMERYAKGYKNTLKEKRAMKQDLRIATRIQADMMPEQFQSLKSYPYINVFARLLPAKGVAGDFFDHFFIRNDLFFFVIGDVSGKGIPAALNMVKALTLIRSEAHRSVSIPQIFARVSYHLCRANEEGVFVTAIAGTLNAKTGELLLCDAGHNPPFISQGTEDFMEVSLVKNLPLGVTHDAKYRVTSYILKPNDTFLLYTDGLTEAVNTNDEMFGTERILKATKGRAAKRLEIIFKNLRAAFIDFKGNAIQPDDITVFLLKYVNKAESN